MSGPHEKPARFKTIGFMPRLPSISRAQFRDHYETRHAPLAVGQFRFQRYRRNHLADPALEPGFDCVSEFWVAALSDILEPMASGAGETMRIDELNFLDQPRASAAYAEPLATGGDAGTTLLPIHDEGGDRDALAAAARAAGAGLDLLKPMDERPLPCDAILRCTGEPPPLPPGWRAGQAFAVDACETDPRLLAA